MSALLSILWLAAVLLLGGCAGLAQPNPLALAAEVLAGGSGGGVSSDGVPGNGVSAAGSVQPAAEDVTPTPPAQDSAAQDGSGGAAPTALTIPVIHLGAEVTPMGWELAMNGDVVTTRWVVPLDTLGWAVNSAAAGAPGNTIIVGHQALGAELFRPLALGEVRVGQEIELQGDDGVTYVYRVSEVSPPIPAIGATAEETAQAAAYLAPAPDPSLDPSVAPRLTLVSGWPADTTTHRLFVVAEYEGKAP